MIPCRLTGKPFWDIYLYQDPPLWRAYLDAVRYYDIDGWLTYANLRYTYPPNDVQFTLSGEEIVRRENGWIITRTTTHTPAGDLWTERTYYPDNPPTFTRKLVKDVEQDMPKLRHMYPIPTGYDASELELMRREVGEDGVVGMAIIPPGLGSLFGLFDGGLAPGIYAYHDHRDLVLELIEMMAAVTLRKTEMAIDARPDYILTGGSGLWTFNTPQAFRELYLPTFQKQTRMCKEAGVPTMVHSCGKERQLVEIFASESDLDCINPLEPPPMGDCDLAEVKQKFGHRLSLMGNLHTTEVMLHGTPEDVARAAREAIDAAGKGGGFILSTGDQCGRDTPDENIFTLVRTAREYGRY
ncbi:MAG: hypothetical protein HYY04_03935 [Chloroflexi bacterium]|nr:hypothetical protein [Chloroflexota bacterium]